MLSRYLERAAGRGLGDDETPHFERRFRASSARSLEDEANMRCFFNLLSAQDVILDEEGIEVANGTELHAEVATALDELRMEEPSLARDWKGWRLEITDPSGRVLFKIRLDPTRPEPIVGLGSLLFLICCELSEHRANVVANQLF